MKTVFIYALREPGPDGEIRYIGKSNNPVKRLVGHLSKVRKKRNHRTNWIGSLLACGLRPVLEVIDIVPESEWQSWEVAYIEYFRECGCRLTNNTLGGESGPSLPGVLNPFFGKKHTLEMRAKLSEQRQGEKHPLFGKNLSPEWCAAIGAALAGKKKSPEHCKNSSLARVGRRTGKDNHNFGKLVNLGKKLSNNTSGFAGVSWEKTRMTWRMRIVVGKKFFIQHRFSKLEDAVFVHALIMDKFFSK